jgi:hypothetical protein
MARTTRIRTITTMTTGEGAAGHVAERDRLRDLDDLVGECLGATPCRNLRCRRPILP